MILRFGVCVLYLCVCVARGPTSSRVDMGFFYLIVLSRQNKRPAGGMRVHESKSSYLVTGYLFCQRSSLVAVVGHK